MENMAHGLYSSGWRTSVFMFIVCAMTVSISATEGFTVKHEENRLNQGSVSVGGPGGAASPEVTYYLQQMLQVLQERDQHTSLYERVAVLEGKIRDNSEDEIRFKTEFIELKAKIPILEEQITNLTIMKQKSDVFEIKMEKLIHKYEEKLSTLASEIIRLKKNEARFRDLQALRDQTGNSVLLRREIEECPSVGVDLDAVRVGEECLYMAWRSSLNWSSAHDHCQALGGDLAAPQDLEPLKTFLHSTFARGPSLWLGASYDELISSPPPGDQQRSPPYQQHQRPDPRTAALMLHQLKEEDQEGRNQGGGNHNGQGESAMHIQDMPSYLRNEEMQADNRKLSNIADGNMSIRTLPKEKTGIYSIQDILMDAPSEILHTNISLEEKMETQSGNEEIESYMSERSSQVLQEFHNEHLSDSITPMLIQRLPAPESESNPSKIRCLLLWLNQALEYELVGRPCNEQHYFVCQIHKERKQDIPFEPDNLLQE